MRQFRKKRKAKNTEDSVVLRMVCMEVTYEPLGLGTIPEEVVVWHQAVDLGQLDNAIVELEAFLKKYPDHPVLLNWLSNFYQFGGHQEKAFSLMILNYKKNPEYLFARCNYAIYQLKSLKNYKIVPTIFDNTFWLSDLYPEREVFHIAEVDAYFRCIGLYWIYAGKFDQAQGIIDMLKSIDEDLSAIEELERELAENR